MNKEEMVARMDEITLNLDDTFQFRCDRCGNCCRDREDILLSPRDVYKLSKYLNLTPLAFFHQYCISYIGSGSRVPIVRLEAQGEHLTCPLLKGNSCSVHAAKPSVCALYPWGRYMKIDKEDFNAGSLGGATVKYLLQDDVNCGDKSQTHTVREWLEGFDIAVEDEAFIAWNEALAMFSPRIKELETKLRPISKALLWESMKVGLYLNYRTDQEFLPQLRENIKGFKTLLDRTDEALAEEANGEKT